MSVISQYSPVSYTCNGAVTDFAFPYLFLANEDLFIYTTDEDGVIAIITTGITITGVLETAGGEVSFDVAPATGLTLTIERYTPVTQPVDYVSQDNFPAETHERALDRLTLIAQEKVVRSQQDLVALTDYGQLRGVRSSVLPTNYIRHVAANIEADVWADQIWMLIVSTHVDDNANWIRPGDYTNRVWTRIA